MLLPNPQPHHSLYCPRVPSPVPRAGTCSKLPCQRRLPHTQDEMLLSSHTELCLLELVAFLVSLSPSLSPLPLLLKDDLPIVQHWTLEKYIEE